MKTIRSAIVILIVFHLSGIVVGLNLLTLTGVWLITIPLGFVQDVFVAFYRETLEGTVEDLVEEE